MPRLALCALVASLAPVVAVPMVPLQLRACAAADDAYTARYQTFAPNGDGTLRLTTGGERGGGSCLEVEYGFAADNTLVQTYRCQPTNAAQQWAFSGAELKSRNTASSCLDIVPPAQPTAWVVQRTCNGGASQEWAYNAGSSRILHVATGMCLDAGSQSWPCASPRYAATTFCNASAPIAARVADGLRRMTLNEKIQQTSVLTASIPSLGVAPYMVRGTWWRLSPRESHGAAARPHVPRHHSIHMRAP